MKKGQFALTLIFTIIFAFLGGLLSSQLLLDNSLFAQGQKKIMAQEFCLVDRRGMTRAVLQAVNNDLITMLRLFDLNGKQRMLFMVDGHGTPSAHFWNKNADGSYKPAGIPSISFWNNSAKLSGRVPNGGQVRRLNVGPLKKFGIEVKGDQVTVGDLDNIRLQIYEMMNKLDEIIKQLSE